MRRPNYGAVTGVTAVLVGVCAVRSAFLDLIPPPHPELATEGRGEYVGRGAAQDVEWRSPDLKPPGGRPSAFDEAQRLSRPLLVVVGLPWSGAARQADEAFAQPEVARAINRGFVAIRVDAANDPRWISQFLPLQRMRAGIRPGFQAWTFDLKRRLIAFTSQTDAGDDLRYTSLLDSLLKSQGDFANAVLADADPRLQADQLNDSRQLLQPALSRISLGSAAPALVGAMDMEWGGWSESGVLFNRPLAFRFLQLAGAWPEAGQSLRNCVLSPRADWLDGGFYRLVQRRDGFPEYDKPAVANAQMAEALAVQDALQPDPLLRSFARRTVDWLLSLRGNEGLAGAEMGDEDARGRSARAAFSPQRLRDGVASGALKELDRAWAASSLRLDAFAHLARPVPTALGDPRLEPVLAALRRSAGPQRKRVASGLCDVNATVAACLLHCARLWNDADLARAASTLVDGLDSFTPNPLPRHALTDASDARPYLGDALGYADAMLEDFLASGRVPSLESGAATLRAALRTFGGPEPGILRPSPVGTELLPGVAELPQVTDDEREALSASALRLLHAYGTVLGSAGHDFENYAVDLAPRLSAVAEALPGLGGVLGALVQYGDSGAVIVVGPDALSLSATLSRVLPNRLVAPALGPVRPDLQRRPAGLYLVVGNEVEGPLSRMEIIRHLPNSLQIRG